MKVKQPEYEEKFIVINKKHLPQGMYRHLTEQLLEALENLRPELPDNKYYVCNQDEDYAPIVLRLIMLGEQRKEIKKDSDELLEGRIE